MTQTNEAILRGVTPAGWMYESAGLDWSEIRFDQHEVTPHGQTESALYTAEQVLAIRREAVAHERAAIVEWLRERHSGNLVSQMAIAHLIETGAHLPTAPQGGE